VFNKQLRLVNTVKFLKPIQIYYRLYYFGRNRANKLLSKETPFLKISKSTPLKLQKSIHIVNCYTSNKNFTFLNLNKKFEDKIDWNYNGYGKLWTYNLTYFDYLSQENIEGESLINDFIENINLVNDGLEPFPISLRGINWIKYLIYNSIKNPKIDNSLYAQYYILLDSLEYHLLGNHLLENGFSLLFGAYYFRDEKLYKHAKKILVSELNEQILDDGGHFELSPMYHQIMLFRVLDCLNLINNNEWKNQELLNLFTQKAQIMLGWLKEISYRDGTIPLFNDSSNKIAPTTYQLNTYADRLELHPQVINLKSSGYRKFTDDNFELFVDVGEVGASYIPGHAHSDTFNFELSLKEKPFIVDTGLSTYETSPRRSFERSTSAHNTVEINSKNQSDVWGGFRVANRASVITLEEDSTFVEATHNGYEKDGVFHTRRWEVESNKIIIEDSLTNEVEAIARFHFHPSITENEILKRVTFEKFDYKITSYMFSPEFNTQIEAKVLEVSFTKSLKTTISIV